jgi:hypothetical protein
MNDTETRLRDYLQAKASTVPDTAQGPGLETPDGSHRRWPVMLAAAGIAAILVLAASFLTRQPDTQVAPAGPVSGAAPRVPYTVSQGRGVTLHDGARQVRVPSTFLFDGFFRGRVGGGWLTLETPRNRPMQVGLLLPDGSLPPARPSRRAGPGPVA